MIVVIDRPSERQTLRLKYIAGLAAAIAAPPAAFSAYAASLAATGNFVVVEPGQVYRSGQPNDAALRSFAETQGRGSVINLRGSAPRRDWYNAEIAAAKANGLAHFDFRMSADEAILPDEARKLIALIAEAPKPVLIHCNAGADRSGLAAALYLYDKGQVSRAKSQLSMRYGHFPYLWSRTGAMDDSLSAFLGDVRVARTEKLGVRP